MSSTQDIEDFLNDVPSDFFSETVHCNGYVNANQFNSLEEYKNGIINYYNEIMKNLGSEVGLLEGYMDSYEDLMNESITIDQARELFWSIFNHQNFNDRIRFLFNSREN